MAIEDDGEKCRELMLLLEQAQRRVAEIDAEEIRKASDGWGTDDAKVISLLTG